MIQRFLHEHLCKNIHLKLLVCEVEWPCLVKDPVRIANVFICSYLIYSTRPVGSDKYLVCNLRQILSQCAHAHKPLDCSHIHQQHSTASTAQPARISSELSTRRRWQSKESTGAMISEESYKLCVTSNRAWGTLLNNNQTTAWNQKHLSWSDLNVSLSL